MEEQIRDIDDFITIESLEIKNKIIEKVKESPLNDIFNFIKDNLQLEIKFGDTITTPAAILDKLKIFEDKDIFNLNKKGVERLYKLAVIIALTLASKEITQLPPN